jgi:hypothetical protein
MNVSVDLNAKNIWAALTGSKKGDNVTTAAIVEVLDTILESKAASTAFNAVMIANNAASMYRNTRGGYPANKNKAVAPIYAAIQNASTSLVTTPAMHSLLQATVEPNIAGIPISSASVDTNREVEISESQVIVQSTRQKKYWTDNAAPRLKEWTISGYLTSMSPLDNGQLIKPSLQWQAYYLDVCASSRRPVTFKTNRGEFVRVQITNLHTVEEASYNNAIKIEISLKEYNPYFVTSNMGENKIAIRIGSFEVSL